MEVNDSFCLTTSVSSRRPPLSSKFLMWCLQHLPLAHSGCHGALFWNLTFHKSTTLRVFVLLMPSAGHRMLQLTVWLHLTFLQPLQLSCFLTVLNLIGRTSMPSPLFCSLVIHTNYYDSIGHMIISLHF
jgi:hypothetical protein